MSKSTRNDYFVHTLLRARDWQHRPQFDQVGDWWRSSSMGSQPVKSGSGRGVCALVGMGGAGKTAIADRFLNNLLDNRNPTRQRGAQASSVFVYSFYDDDKPENFFRHLQIWLEGTSAPDKQRSPTQMMFDPAGGCIKKFGHGTPSTPLNLDAHSIAAPTRTVAGGYSR